MEFLDFEKSIAELESKLEELKHLSDTEELNITNEVLRLQKKVKKLLKQTYIKLSPWQKVQVARHPNRPYFLDYVKAFIGDFVELAGDRSFSDDKAIIGGLGRLKNKPVMLIGHQKGRDTSDRIKRNFGMPKPEGYRKAARLMKLAEKFSLPVITFIDSAGAMPGVDAEERGQAEAIAKCIDVSLNLKVPVISVVTGEGMSGGAIAIGVANKILMLEHAIYSVISPEGCASILWRSAEKKQKAAEYQKLTADDLFKLGIIDEIIKEPLGGAHRSYSDMAKSIENALSNSLQSLSLLSKEKLYNQRVEKFLVIGRNKI